MKPALLPPPRGCDPAPGRPRALALALAGLVLTACPTTMGETETTASGTDTDTDGGVANKLCVRYVGCVGEVNPGGLSAIDGRLGEAGTCWSEAIVDQDACVDECAAGLTKANLDHPSVAACAPPAEQSDAVFEIGQAIFDPEDPFAEPTWAPLSAGDTIEMVRGGQGLLMFAIGLRGANFVIAENPTQFDDPMMPQVDMWMDIDGYNIGYGGHFARIYNYPIPFRPLDGADGIVEFLYVAVIVPDEISEPVVLDGQPGHLWIQLFPYEEAPILRELDVVIEVPSADI
ncbi:MAG: hypothetical protein R3A79_01935 [Nannocystaceae bacterium]